MRIKQLLKNTLLVAAGLCMGAGNAWATEGDVIYSNDFSTNDQTNFATWTATSKKPSGYSYAQIGRGGSFSIGTGALVWSASTGGNNGSYPNASVGVFNSNITTATQSNYVLEFDVTIAVENITKDYFYEISDEDKKVIICIYGNHTRNGKSSGSTVYGYIVGGDNGFQVVEAGATKSTNAEGTIGNGTKVPLTDAISEVSGSKTYHVKLDVKTTLGTATLTIKEGETTLVDDAPVNINAKSGLKYMCFEGVNNYGTPSSVTLDNLSITEGAASIAATADYTVKYVADIDGVETEIKSQDVRTGVVGAAISLQDADKNTIWYNNKKYLYSSDDASTSTIADDNSTVVKVVFAEAPSYTYSVVDNLGNNLASGSSYQGENVVFYVPYYAFKDNKFYTSPSLNSGTLSYGQGKITAIAENTNITVTYTEEENTNVVFFSEAENLTDVSSYEDDYTQIRMSNGKAGYYGEQTAFITLPAGVYTLKTSTRAGTTRFYAGTVGEGTEIASVSSSGAVTTQTSEPFLLKETTDIYTSVGSSTAYFDYVIIRKIYDVTDASKIVGAVDYTSEANSVRSENYTMKKGDVKVFAFQNHGQDMGKNWRIEVKEGETWKANLCADSWDYNGNGAKANVTAYMMSYDGGQTKQAINDEVTETSWATYAAKMADAYCVATLSYGDDGTLRITTTSTNGDYIYYVDHNVTGLSSDLTINLSVNESWLEVLSENQTAVGATTTSAGKGWATLYTDKALDFSGVDGLTAYTATLSENTVSLTEVQNVPAGTGVVLKSSVAGENTTYSIPVIAISSTAQGNMTGSTTDTPLAANTAYLLGINNAGKAQFFINSAGTIAAGKAYLPAGNGGAKALSVVFANDLTGIATVNAVETAQPVKRIMNGQLVIEKNGKRYNAAGAEF